MFFIDVIFTTIEVEPTFDHQSSMDVEGVLSHVIRLRCVVIPRYKFSRVARFDRTPSRALFPENRSLIGARVCFTENDSAGRRFRVNLARNWCNRPATSEKFTLSRGGAYTAAITGPVARA